MYTPSTERAKDVSRFHCRRSSVLVSCVLLFQAAVPAASDEIKLQPSVHSELQTNDSSGTLSTFGTLPSSSLPSVPVDKAHVTAAFVGPDLQRKTSGVTSTTGDQLEVIMISPTQGSFRESPGEIKRREVSWTLTKKLDFYLRVQRGELDSHDERLSFAGPGEIKRREVVLDPQESPGEIKSREGKRVRGWGQVRIQNFKSLYWYCL